MEIHQILRVIRNLLLAVRNYFIGNLLTQKNPAVSNGAFVFWVNDGI